MAEDLNAVCVVCGKGYHCCLSCKDERTFKPWRSITDSIEHYKIFLILSDYNNNRITKDEAKTQLSRIDYNIKDLKESIQNNISEILKEEKQIKNDTAFIQKKYHKR